MQQQNTEALIFAIVGLLALCFIVVFLFVVFQKKKNVLLIKQIEAQQQFEQEIAETQVEIREQTLRNISWELHDNIGQLLTLAKIQLQNVKENPENIAEVNQNLTKILNEVRALSKIINPDFISNIQLEEALSLEIQRFNRLNYIKAELIVEGNRFTMDSKTDIIIFRILQEFFSNTIKHSKASLLSVYLKYDNDKLFIFAKDNGKGYTNQESNLDGIGLSNMKKRAHLIKARITIESKIDEGTQISIVYKKPTLDND